MLARVLLGAAMAASAIAAPAPAAVLRQQVVVRHIRPGFRPFFGFRRRLLVPRPPRLNLPTPGEVEPPGVEGVPAPSEGGTFAPQSFPHGFIITVAVGTHPRPSMPRPIGRFIEVGQALEACWTPPVPTGTASWHDITLRVSFKRDGTINGVPRIPYVLAGDARSEADLRASLLDALRACTPLPLTPALGAAVAGEIFAIRFTNGTTR